MLQLLFVPTSNHNLIESHDQYFNWHVEMTTLTPPLFITVPVPQVSSAVYTTSTVSGHAYVCLGYWFDFLQNKS
jgi:hypothetical protein